MTGARGRGAVGSGGMAARAAPKGGRRDGPNPRVPAPARDEDRTMNWRFAYSIGFHPWEDAVTDPPFVEKAAELFAREEEGREPPFGPALDLGTGSGIWAI